MLKGVPGGVNESSGGGSAMTFFGRGGLREHFKGKSLMNSQGLKWGEMIWLLVKG